MRKNIQKVLAAFAIGKAANGDAKRTCSTDGTEIFSYAMRIAWRNPDGTIEVVPYEDGPSRTTKSQIRACQLFFSREPLVDVARDAQALPSECPACGGNAEVMGALGSRVHFRCRACGIDSSAVDSAAE